MGRRLVVNPATIAATRGGTSLHDFWAKGLSNQTGDLAQLKLETDQAGFCRRNLTLGDLKRLAIANGVAGGVRGYATLVGL